MGLYIVVMSSAAFFHPRLSELNIMRSCVLVWFDFDVC